jgi:hypothetical protein
MADDFNMDAFMKAANAINPPSPPGKAAANDFNMDAFFSRELSTRQTIRGPRLAHRPLLSRFIKNRLFGIWIALGMLEPSQPISRRLLQ